ncbi:transglycosylase SLT domain-containing protein [Rhodoferax sp.]|uniref:lytic transglycosylase domain-containing protein n=1 Tax=Rhodoferax sp. TaxID=50421 RepID=UPI0028416D3A|nr:transglycosylase SLT domain-containing protein [Rhodoferax sp.]MDR3370134.1 transglycosylase SLT domain-containing protein [Rhodoferax sp.]
MLYSLTPFHRLRRPSVLGAVMAFPLCAIGQVYVSEASASGAIVLSNFQSDQTPVLLLAPVIEPPSAKPMASLGTSSVHAMPARAAKLRPMIDGVANSVKLAPGLINAVISAESNYDARAVSPRGAIGLMQLMPATAKRFGVTNPFVERDNVYAGASYLKWLLDFFEGDLELALAGYNAGEQAVMKAGRKIPQYPETQAYVRRVMANL